jgi:hypothetical protein
MESVTPLYESILDRTKDKVGSVKKRLHALGVRWPIEKVLVGNLAEGSGIFTRLNKSNTYNDEVDRLSMISNPEIKGCYDYIEQDVSRLITFIDNIDVKYCTDFWQLPQTIKNALEKHVGFRVVDCMGCNKTNNTYSFTIYKGTIPILSVWIKV